MCNCNSNIHRVTNFTVGEAVNLNVTDSTNIGDKENFGLVISCKKAMNIPAAPLPVTISINGVAMPVLNKNAQWVQSNNLPRRAFGKVVLTSNTSTVTAPYLILHTTPCCNR